MKEIAAIVNLTAGRGKCERIWPQIEQYLRQLGFYVKVYFTQGIGHATQLARNLAENNNQQIVAVGGDGTLHEVANGLVDYPNITLGVIPAGSGNDFIRSLGLHPDDWQTACQIIMRGDSKVIDLGQINGSYFINVAGVGFDAAVANCANVWGKRYFKGTMAYIAALLKILWNFQQVPIRIELDDRIVKTKGWMVSVANAKYLGGGMKVAPQADMHDGLFDICVLGNCSKWTFLRAFPQVFQGTHLNHPAIKVYRTKDVTIEAANPLLVQADGEIVAETPIHFSILPAALRVFC